MVTMRRWFAASMFGLLLSGSAFAQTVFVRPRTAGQNQVRYFDFEWRHIDILVGPKADKEAAPFIHKVPGTSASPINPTATPGGTSPASPSPQVQGIAPGKGDSNAPGIVLPPASDAGIALPVESDGGTPAPVAGTPDGGPGLATAPGDTGVDGGVALTGDAGTGLAATADGGKPVAQAPTDGGVPYAIDLGQRSGGVRLYFYEREREVAERAAGFITDSYRYLVEQFRYVPTQTFPYVLYSSYQEFLETNLFPLSEGTLGVTGTKDLKLTLPYFGDHRLFDEVGTHEMAHQFTIQKVRTLAEKSEIGIFGDPLDAIPLWFIEGLAEFYAHRGIDPETEMLARDLVVNPDPFRGYAMLDFFDEGPLSVLWIYKMGQARCAFFEQIYGKGTLQRILEASTGLVGRYRERAPVNDFKQLVERVTGDPPERISKRFEVWLKRKSFKSYLDADQEAPSFEPLTAKEEHDVMADSIATSPDGNLMMFRTINPETGESRLMLLDRRVPERKEVVAADGRPGIESLHPIDGRSFALGTESLAFVAQSRGYDVIYWQELSARAQIRNLGASDRRLYPRSAAPAYGPPMGDRDDTPWVVDFRLGRRRGFHLEKKGLVAAYSPSFSPDGKRLAFVGLDRKGVRDVYILEPGSGDDFTLRKATDDVYSERQTAWGAAGIVYSSDATPKGRYNLFRFQPDTQERVQLTAEDRDHFDPVVLPDGRVYFAAFHSGRSDLYEVVGEQIIQRTDTPTGLFSVSAGPAGSMWALFHRGGTRRPVRIKSERLLSAATVPQTPGGTPRLLPEYPIRTDVPYEKYALKNWELGQLVAYGGGAATADGRAVILGQLFALANDRLRNHALLLNVGIYGSFELTDGFLLYLNEEHRTSYGVGLFQSINFRFPSFNNVPFSLTSGDRFFGATGSVRYPFNRFVHLEGGLSLGGVRYFIEPGVRDYLLDPSLFGSGEPLLTSWERQFAPMRFQTQLGARFGYDTLRLHRFTGPLTGDTFLLDGSASWQPSYRQFFGNARMDAAKYFAISGRANFHIRAAAGGTFGGQLAPQFYLSSWDTLRGVRFGDPAWLFGRHFLVTTAELQLPLNSLVRLVFLADVEGIVGVDFGAVDDRIRGLWDKRVLDAVVGLNFTLGPLLFRLHFARPFNTGAAAGMPVTDGSWVTNFSFGIAGLDMFFGKRQEKQVWLPRAQMVGDMPAIGSPMVPGR
jgi:hypothetical protein